MKKRALIVVAFIAILFTGCCKDTQETTPQDFFTLWNSCESLTALIDFVEDATNPSSSNYIKPEDRIATFDMDGTFVGELYPTYFEYNMLEYRALDDPSYKDKAPASVKKL